MTTSAFAGQGMKRLVDNSLAQYEAQNQQKIAILQERQRLQEEELRRQQEAAAVQQAQIASQVASETGQPVAPANPMLDPNGNFAKYINEKGVTLEDYLTKMPSIQREREFVTPYLEEMWVKQNLPRAVQQGLTGSKLEQARDEYLRTGRAMAGADFLDRQAEVGLPERAGSLANAAGRGLVGLVDSASGLIKTVAGDDNIVSRGLGAGVEGANEALKGMNNAEQQELVDYFKSLASKGEVAKMAKLVADYPVSIVTDQLAEQMAPLGAFAKGATAISKATGLAKVGDKLAESGRAGKFLTDNAKIAAYSGYQMSGGMAQELSEAGIDPNSEGGIMAVGLAGLGGAAISAFTPSNLEKTILRNFMGRGLPENTSKVLAKETLEKLSAGGLFKTPTRYGMGLAKNVSKGALGEGAEEGMQSGLEGYARQMVNQDGTWRDLSTTPWTEADSNAVATRATTGAVLGAGLGGAAKGLSNSLNRFADNERSRLYEDNKFYDNQAEQGVYAAPNTDVDNMTPAERALFDRAEQVRTEKAEKEAEAVRVQEEETSAREEAARIKEEENRANAEIESKYGEFSKTAKGDRATTTSAQAVPTEVSAILEEIMANNTTGVPGVPQDLAQAQAELNAITDPVAKSSKLTEWATATANENAKVRIAGLTKKLVNGYSFNPDGSYANTTAQIDVDNIMNTAVQKMTGTVSQDLQGALTNIRTSNPEMAPLVDAYKSAMSDGYYNTAKEIADKFNATVDKRVRKNPPPKQNIVVSDTVNKSRHVNAQNIGTITQAMHGARHWSSPKVRTAFKEDPIAYVDELIETVAGAPIQALKPEEVRAINTELGNLREAWKNDQAYDLKLTPELIERLTQVK